MAKVKRANRVFGQKALLLRLHRVDAHVEFDVGPALVDVGLRVGVGDLGCGQRLLLHRVGLVLDCVENTRHGEPVGGVYGVLARGQGVELGGDGIELGGASIGRRFGERRSNWQVNELADRGCYVLWRCFSNDLCC